MQKPNTPSANVLEHILRGFHITRIPKSNHNPFTPLKFHNFYWYERQGLNTIQPFTKTIPTESVYSHKQILKQVRKADKLVRSKNKWGDKKSWVGWVINA